MKKLLIFTMLLIILVSCQKTPLEKPEEKEDYLQSVISTMDVLNNYEIHIGITFGNRAKQTINLKFDGNKSSFKSFNEYIIYEIDENKLNVFENHGQDWILTTSSSLDDIPFYKTIKDDMFEFEEDMYVMKESYLGEFDEFFAQSYEWFQLIELSLTVQNDQIVVMNYVLELEMSHIHVEMSFDNYNAISIEIPIID